MWTQGQSTGYALAGYDPATGQRDLMARFVPTGPASAAIPSSLAVSPDGNRVYVSGKTVDGGPEGAGLAARTNQITVVAYDVASGAWAWETRHDVKEAVSPARDLAVTPDGSQVIVAGFSGSASIWGFDLQPAYQRGGIATEMVIAGIDATDGKELWAQTGWPAVDLSFGLGIAPSPDGARMYAMSGFSATGTADTVKWTAIYGAVPDDVVLPVGGNTLDYGLVTFDMG